MYISCISLFIFLVYMCVPVCVGVCMHVCVHACGSQSLMLSVFLSYSLRHSFLNLLLDLCSLNGLDWLASKLQGSSCLCLSRAGTVGTCHCTWLFVCGSGSSHSGPHTCTVSTLATVPKCPLFLYVSLKVFFVCESLGIVLMVVC